MNDGLTPEQRDMVDCCQQIAWTPEDEPLPRYLPALVRAAAWIVAVLLALTWAAR